MIRAHSAIEADHVGTEFVQSCRKCFGRRSEICLAVHLNGHLGDDRQIANFLYRPHGLFDDGKLRKCFENEKVNAAFKQCFGLFFEKIPCFVKRRRPIRFDTQAQWPDRSRNKNSLTRRLSGKAGGGDIDVAELALQTVRLKLMPRRSERIGFDDVRTGFYILLVDFAN